MLAVIDRSRRLLGPVLFGTLLVLGGSHAKAQVLVYSNVTNFTGFGYASGVSATISGDGTTALLADELSFAPGFAGSSINGFTFSTANLNPGAVTARPLVRFYDDSGSGGGPGALLGGFNFNPISFAAGSVQLFTFNSANEFTVPADDTIWAAIAFDNNGGAEGDASLAQLNSLGQGIFNPPTVGSSGDFFFQSTSASSFLTSNPAGSFFFFGGNPVANFGWAFTAPPPPAQSTPEPGSVALLSAFVLTGLGAFGKSRMNKKRI